MGALASLPVAAFRRASTPSPSATYRLSPDSAGVKTAVPALFIEYFQTVLGTMPPLSSTSGAGWFLVSFEPNKEQPANIANTLAAITFSVIRIF